MRYLILLPFLSSCSLLDAISPGSGTYDPVVAEAVVGGAMDVTTAVATGQWGKAIWGAVGIGTAIVAHYSHKGGKAVIAKVKASEPGKVFG